MEEVIFVHPETSYKIFDLKQELMPKLEHLILSSKSQLTVELSLLEKMLEYLKLSESQQTSSERLFMRISNRKTVKPNKKRSNSLAKPKPGRQNSQNQKQIDHHSTAHGALGPCTVDQSINVGASQNQDRVDNRFKNALATYDNNDNNFVNICTAPFQINNEEIISSSDSYVLSPDFNVSSPDFNVSSPDSNGLAPDSNVLSPDFNADSNVMSPMPYDMSPMSYDMSPMSYVIDFAGNNNFDTQIYNDYYYYYFHPNMSFMFDDQFQWYNAIIVAIIFNRLCNVPMAIESENWRYTF
ncbi:5552_t:CDS:2 [Scutellospora calospora]|uniref:5552_t:CDS:1 n=1 Tax=Scutellospora calospora TaxID=85575 RepID=A0ACA9LAF3_9GLOM|nr:5552_t:CDS:2 [Scutellospora calospora]